MSGTAPLRTEEQVRKAIREAGSMKAAAASLGVSRTTLYEYIRRYGIDVERRLAA